MPRPSSFSKLYERWERHHESVLDQARAFSEVEQVGYANGQESSALKKLRRLSKRGHKVVESERILVDELLRVANSDEERSLAQSAHRKQERLPYRFTHYPPARPLPNGFARRY